MELDELVDNRPKKDYRRANGAPMVSDPEHPGKMLRYSRPSGWGKDLDDESALVTWKVNTAIKGVAHDRALIAKIVAAGDDKEALKDLREEAIAAGRGNEASDVGTALHAMSQRIDSQDGWVAPEPFHSRLMQYLDVITIAGLVPEYIEVHMVNDPMRCAGTADRIYRTIRPLVVPDGTIIDAGSLIMADLKTGKMEYSIPGYAVQLALYADGEFYDIESDQRLTTPFIHPQWGLLVHLPAEGNTCTLWWTNLEIGRTGARLVRDVRSWRKRNDHVQNFNFPDEPQALLVTGESVDDEQVTLDDEPYRPTEDELSNEQWLAMMATWMRERINVIGKNRSARTHLLRLWPEGLPTLKAGGHSREQMVAVHGLLCETEKAYSLPFSEDPRTKYHRGHKSTSNQGANEHVQ